MEGEVAKKEDEITALKPITLEKKVISSLTGMSYTSDGTRLYAQSITLLATESNWDSPNITYNNPVSYIDIPLDINKDQVITIPRFRTSYSVSEAATFMLGSYDANGLFYPIFFQAKGNSNNGLCWLISNNYPEAVGTTYFDGIGARGSSFGALNVSSDKVYIQAKYDESSGFYIRTFGAYPDDSSSTGLQIVYTSPADIERLRQITACRFINMGKMNTAATATLATLFGRYDGAHLERGTLPDLTNIPNSFSLTDVQSLNYLQLNLGSGLSVVDGKLTASSTAPTNMVTTDTAQTISGDKELTGITTISNDIKFTIGKKITTPDGEWLMQLGPGFIGIGTSMKPLQTYDGSNYYLHNKSIIAGNGIKITEPNSSEIEISSTSTAYVTEEFVDGTEGYRVWSNGRCEQWGRYSLDSSTGEQHLIFLKEYKDTNYLVLIAKTSADASAWNVMLGPITDWSTSGLLIKANLTGYVLRGPWYVSGILAS